MRYFLLVLGLLIAPIAGAQAKVTIFACVPEWASLAEEVGGDKVRVTSATHAKQNPHYIRARPSLLARIGRADLVICSGASLEAGWLPILLERAPAQVQMGAVGHISAARYVSVLEKPTRLDRSQGDIHAEGNPHVHLNPANVLLVAREISRRLQMIDADNAAFYATRLARFSQKWQRAMAEWTRRASVLRGKSLVVHHRNFSYLADWLGMDIAASLEPVPGLAPTASHLEGLLKQFKHAPALAIIRTPYEPDDASEWLSEKTGSPALVLPYTVGGDAKSGDLFALFDRTIALLREVANRR